MGIFPIGDQRIGVERDVPVLDGGGDPVYDELGSPQVTTTTLWVDGALFEAQTPTEQAGFLTQAATMATAILPVTPDGDIPAVDDDDQPAPLAFFDGGGSPSITANARILCDGVRYEMRGDAVLERDIRGRPNHVFCGCERKGL